MHRRSRAPARIRAPGVGVDPAPDGLVVDGTLPTREAPSCFREPRGAAPRNSHSGPRDASPSTLTALVQGWAASPSPRSSIQLTFGGRMQTDTLKLRPEPASNSKPRPLEAVSLRASYVITLSVARCRADSSLTANRGNADCLGAYSQIMSSSATCVQ